MPESWDKVLVIPGFSNILKPLQRTARTKTKEDFELNPLSMKPLFSQFLVDFISDSLHSYKTVHTQSNQKFNLNIPNCFYLWVVSVRNYDWVKDKEIRNNDSNVLENILIDQIIGLC